MLKPFVALWIVCERSNSGAAADERDGSLAFVMTECRAAEVRERDCLTFKFISHDE